MRSTQSIQFAPRVHTLRPASCALRPAFTLVELLVVITILAILASLLLFALAGAQETAIEMRTRGTIVKLHNIIMQKLESYKTRRLSIVIPPGSAPPVAAQLRLDALRELMRMEMPDRYSDINDAPSVLPAVPSATLAYRAALPLSAINSYQDAKCLYLLVTKGCDDPDVIEQFAPYEIGIPDSDGMKVFVDGWGHPISFLRWAPGYRSPLQDFDVNASTPAANRVYPTQHDPFDPYQVYKPVAGDLFYHAANIPNPGDPAGGTYPTLFPLIYSAGADGEYEVEISTTPSPGHQYSTTTPKNNPYAPTSSGALIGSWRDSNGDGTDNRIDNITNHEIETR